MGTENKHKSKLPEQRKSKKSEELESMAARKDSESEDREDTRLEDEREQQGDLNQGMQTGTHDASHPGIKWGTSYKTKKRNAKSGSKDSKAKR